MNVKGGSRCCVNQCKSFSRTHRDLANQKISFYKFPRDTMLREEWIARVQLSYAEPKRSIWQPKKTHLVCGLHFHRSGKKKYEDKVPIFIGSHFLTKHVFISKTVNLDDDDRNCILKNIGSEVEVSTEMGKLKDILTECVPQLSQQYEQADYQSDHAYCSTVESDIHDLRELYKSSQKNQKEMAKELADSKKAISNLELEISKLKAKNLCLQSAIVEKDTELSNKKFSLKNVSQNKEMLQFYTGFSSKEELDILFQYLEPELPKISLHNTGEGYIRSTERKEGSTGRPMALDFKEQLFLTLCKLRVGLVYQDLGYRFEISKMTVSNYITTWLHLMHKKLTVIPTWLSREVVNEHIVASEPQ